MDSILLKIRALYNDMGRGEKKIADWILAHPQEIIRLSISDLAAECGCGDATIVRFSRRLGLSGYQALKIGIAQESPTAAVGGSILDSDSCFEIFTKRGNDIALAIENTRSVLDPKQLEQAAVTILKAGRIAIFGLGNSASVALDAQHKFLRAGLDATAYCDNHMQAIAASHLKSGDVAIGISHSGSSTDVVDALHLAKAGGATTICLTNAGQSPILKESDLVLFTHAEETRYSILAMSSRIAQLAIFDAIYTYIVVHSERAVREAIRETERALQTKKF